MNVPFALLLVLIWPLMLAIALTHAGTRPVAMHLAPWAAVPALVLGLAFDDSMLHVPGTMLGAVLYFDAGGRVFLLLTATLSLAAGLLARERVKGWGSAHRYTLFLLLATTGALALALAGDALMFFTASTLLGYALYGMMATESTAAVASARAFVVMLVVSDLVVFELLLVLAHEAGGIAFDTLRQALQLVDFPASTFTLLLFGFGLKVGLVGLHLWLAPVFVGAAAPVRPLLLAFVFCAGMLGWLRLLPLGEVHWPDGGALLQGLALVTLLYATLVGMMQAHWRSALAYGVMAMSGLLLWLLGAILIEPGLWRGLFSALHRTLLQSGFSFTVLFLLPGPILDSSSWRRRGIIVLGWLAVLLLVAAPLQVIAALSRLAPETSVRFVWLAAAFSLLPMRCLLFTRTVPATPGTMWTVGGLSLAALLVTLELFTASSWVALGWPSLLLLLVAVLGWLAGEALAKHLPVIPPGDLFLPLERALVALVGSLTRLAGTQLPLLRNKGLASLQRVIERLQWLKFVGRVEIHLGRWPVAMLLLLLLGLTLGGWGSAG